MNLPCAFKKCPGSLHFTLLVSADSCRMWEIEVAGTVELVHVGILLRMGCDSLLMLMCGSDGGGEPLWEQNGLPCEHSVGNHGHLHLHQRNWGPPIRPLHIQRTQFPPNSSHQKDVFSTLDYLYNTCRIDHITRHHLTPPKPACTPLFYDLPKVHKPQ